MITIIKGKLPKDMLTQFGTLGMEVEEMHEETTFIASYEDSSDPDIINRPSSGYVNEKTRIVNDTYWPLVLGIKKNYPDETSFINMRRILFLEDTEWEMTDKTTTNSRWKVQIQAAPKAIRDMFGVDYVIKTRRYWTQQMSESQKAAMVMSELLRIDKEKGSILKLTSESYSMFTSTFGSKWLEKGAGNIPDVSKERVELVGLPTADGQQSIFKVCEITGPEEE